MNDWAEHGYKETYELFGIKHDKNYYESEIYDKGKEIVFDGLKKGIFERLEDGAVVVRFNKKQLPKMKVLLRKEGTSLYVTQDIYLAFKKMEDFDYDLSIFIIGNEQDMQLRTVFEILKLLGMKGNNLHYSYGMIYLPSGKMKSREGDTVEADQVVKDIKKLALVEVNKRYNKLSKKDIHSRAEKISMAALRFYLLKYDYSKDFVFDPQKSLSFEGETGPYLMYVYARICSIFKKANEQELDIPYYPDTNKINDEFEFSKLDFALYSDEHETNLIDLLNKYPKIINDSAKNLKPHILTRYLLSLSQEFNQFYHSCPIIKESEDLRNTRLGLCELIRRVLHHGLSLLNIEILNEM
jgi:arginyl-tRNA synthetase